MISRRRFLAGSAGLALAAAGCTDDRGGSGAPNPDLDLAATAASIEKVVVDAYTAMRTMAVQGRLGAAVPEVVVEFLTAATGHHQEHLNTWNRALTAGGRGAVDAPDPELRRTVDAAMVRLLDIPALVGLALRIEDHACQTYLQAIPTLRRPETIRTTGQILVVDQQHQAVLRYVLGLNPVGHGVSPDTMDFAPAEPSPDLLTS